MGLFSHTARSWAMRVLVPWCRSVRACVRVHVLRVRLCVWCVVCVCVRTCRVESEEEKKGSKEYEFSIPSLLLLAS